MSDIDKMLNDTNIDKVMTQGDNYEPEHKESETVSSTVDIPDLNQNEEDILDPYKVESKAQVPESKLNITMPQIDKRITIIIAAAAIVLLVGGFLAFKMGWFNSEPDVPDWAKEVEDGLSEEAFSYTPEEVASLRDNGYTADDIEKYEILETDPDILIEEAANRRKALYDAEIKPYLDNATPEFKQLQEMTWLGTGSEPNLIGLNYDDSYIVTGTYNCDFTKVPARGNQLFVKLHVLDLGINVFMSVTADRYNQLPETGNMVINLDYTDYGQGTVIVDRIEEVVISNETY